MSSRKLLIVGIVGGIVAGLGLLGMALAVVAQDGAALSASTMALVILGAAGGWLLDAALLSMAIVRLATPDRGGEDDGGGGDGWDHRGPRPVGPPPPGEDPAWWPEFERDLQAHLGAPDRVPVAH
jgi:hypothetical protein